MREILQDLTKNHGCTVLISSHILGELEKIATHYGIIRDGIMIREMTAEQLDASCPTYIALKVGNMEQAGFVLKMKFQKVKEVEGFLRIYDDVEPEEVVSYLYDSGILVNELRRDKISLEEYYVNLVG